MWLNGVWLPRSRTHVFLNLKRWHGNGLCQCAWPSMPPAFIITHANDSELLRNKHTSGPSGDPMVQNKTDGIAQPTQSTLRVPSASWDHHRPEPQVGASAPSASTKPNRWFTSWRSSTCQSRQRVRSHFPHQNLPTEETTDQHTAEEVNGSSLPSLPDPCIPQSTSMLHSGPKAGTEADFGYSGQRLWFHQVHWHISEASPEVSPLSAPLRWEYAPRLLLTEATSSCPEQMSGRESDVERFIFCNAFIRLNFLSLSLRCSHWIIFMCFMHQHWDRLVIQNPIFCLIMWKTSGYLHFPTFEPKLRLYDLFTKCLMMQHQSRYH